MTLRQEIHTYIDDITENKLLALKPLLFALADDSIVIEKDLTDEERDIIIRGMADYDANPDSFVALSEI
jgi:hypothetical protein